MARRCFIPNSFDHFMTYAVGALRLRQSGTSFLCVRFFRASRGKTAHQKIGTYHSCLAKPAMWIFHMAGLAHPYENARYLSDTAATAIIRIVVCRPAATRAANAALLRRWFSTTTTEAARARVTWVV